MDATNFAARLALTGLRPLADDTAALEALVKDLDRAVAAVREPRPYADEPLSAFRLPR